MPASNSSLDAQGWVTLIGNLAGQVVEGIGTIASATPTGETTATATTDTGANYTVQQQADAEPGVVIFIPQLPANSSSSEAAPMVPTWVWVAGLALAAKMVFDR